MLKLFKKSWFKKISQNISNAEFQQQNPSFTIYHKGKLWTGQICGWKLQQPFLKVYRYENGRRIEFEYDNVTWSYLKNVWLNHKGKFEIF